MYKAKTNSWYLERVIYLIAGLFTMISVGLTLLTQNPWWLTLAVLVSVNLIIFSLSGYCIMATILTKLGLKANCENPIPTK